MPMLKTFSELKYIVSCNYLHRMMTSTDCGDFPIDVTFVYIMRVHGYIMSGRFKDVSKVELEKHCFVG